MAHLWAVARASANSASAAPRVRSGNGPQDNAPPNEDLPASVSVVPLGELPDSRLQHLIGMDECIFAQNGARERVDQLLRRGARWERRLTAEFAHLISINVWDRKMISVPTRH
jgi:hypothetical protein